jgi:hypothetical protein
MGWIVAEIGRYRGRTDKRGTSVDSMRVTAVVSAVTRFHERMHGNLHGQRPAGPYMNDEMIHGCLSY